MKHLKKFNESKKEPDSQLFEEIFQYVTDLSLDFLDLGLDCIVKKTIISGGNSLASQELGSDSKSKAILPNAILVEITDNSYGFSINRDEFNSVVKTIKDYVESYGCNFYVSRYDEHDNYYLDDKGLTKFDDYLKNQGNFYGFEIRIF